MVGVRGEDGESRGRTSAGKRRAGPVSVVTIFIMRTTESRKGCSDPGTVLDSRLCLALGVTLLSAAPSHVSAAFSAFLNTAGQGHVQGCLHTSQWEALRIPFSEECSLPSVSTLSHDPLTVGGKIGVAGSAKVAHDATS